MGVIVFAGPSLREADRLDFPEFSFRPPVRQGELYAAAQAGARAIAIIDGHFDGVPAVWHKEVLWALSRGIAVFGAASMGALRAAELCAFGMVGIGGIFEDFRDGRLSDDDEVALIHGPAEAGYVALSEPMVNIRASIAQALAERILDAGAARDLTARAKALFYQERNWPSLLEAADGLAPSMRAAFRGWLRHGAIDRKRQDAQALLVALRAHDARGGAPASPAFAFEWTEAWAGAAWRSPGRTGLDGDEAMILDELRLEGETYHSTRRAALLALLARGEIAPAPQPTPEEIAATLAQFRLARGLLRQSDVEAWCRRNGLDRAALARLMAEQAGRDRLEREQDDALQRGILDQLRLQGRFPELRDRARQRMVALAGVRRPPPSPILLSWYFETRLGRPIPEDLPGHAAALGIKDCARFLGLLAEDYARCAANGAMRELSTGAAASG